MFRRKVSRVEGGASIRIKASSPNHSLLTSRDVCGLTIDIDYRFLCYASGRGGSNTCQASIATEQLTLYVRAVPTEAREVQSRSRRQRVYLRSLVLELHAEFEQAKLDREASQAFHDRWKVRRDMLEEVHASFWTPFNPLLTWILLWVDWECDVLVQERGCSRTRTRAREIEGRASSWVRGCHSQYPSLTDWFNCCRSVETRLKELGWKTEELPLGEKLYAELVRQPKVLTDKCERHLTFRHTKAYLGCRLVECLAEVRAKTSNNS